MDGVDDFEMQQQQPLLSDPSATAGYPRSPDGPPPLLALNKPRRRSKKAPRSSLSPARFCIGFCAVVGLIVAGLLSWGLYSLLKELWVSISKPHRDVSFPPNLYAQGLFQEHNLVKSYFGPKSDGAFLDTFDLGASIYARVDVVPEVKGVKEGEVDLSWLDEAMGIKPPPPERDDWVLVYQGIVLEDVPISTKPVQTTVPVTIPKDVLSRLGNSSLHPELVASYVVLPPSFEDSPLFNLTQTHWATVKTVSLKYPMLDALPPSWIPYADNSTKWSPFTDFFSYAAVQEPLLIKPVRPNHTDSETYDVVTRSWVTMARDFVRYERGDYEKAQDNLRDHIRKACRTDVVRDVSGDSTCWRRFSVDGHFDTLLELQEKYDEYDEAGVELPAPVNSSQLWYAPFITSRLGSPGRRDFVALPTQNSSSENDAGDFSFAWRITFSTSSPAKLALATDASYFHRLGTDDRSNETAYDVAISQDLAEFFNALIGHPFDSSARPLSRGFLWFVCTALSFINLPLQLYYWMKQSLTTGISIPSRLVDSTNDVLYALFFGLKGLERSTDGLWFLFIDIGCGILILWIQANLALRLEWEWGGFRGWIPVGVSRRRPTHSERSSARTDAKFLWRDRIILFVAICLLQRYLPPMHLISASPPSSMGGSPYDLQLDSDSSFLARTLYPFIYPFKETMWYSLVVSQCLLNHRRKTFAGSLKTNAYILVLLDILASVPTVFHGFLGRSELMDPLSVWDVAALSLNGWKAYQAFLYPRVPQEENEDD